MSLNNVLELSFVAFPIFSISTLKITLKNPYGLKNFGLLSCYVLEYVFLYIKSQLKINQLSLNNVLHIA